MDVISPQDVYARHLVSRRGYPLWTPESSLTLPDVYRREGLKIGDVGVVVPEDGSFDVFFNICLPPSHALHRRRGVPDNFNPVVLDDEDIAIFREAESAGRVISTCSVGRTDRQSSDGITRDAQPRPLDYEFSLSSKEGALLILPEGAERYYLRNQRPFLEEAIQHAIDWYNFAEGRLGRIISHDSLYLITGFYKTRSWSLASYQQASGICGAYAQFKAAQVGRGDVSRSYTWETAPHTLDWRVGPSDRYYNGIPNQSIFIQGFKISVRSSILGAKRVKVKDDLPSVRHHRVTFYGSARRSSNARSSSSRSSAPTASTSRATDADSELHGDTPEGGFDNDSSISGDDPDVTVQHVPQVSTPFHPSDIINQYLLRSHPSAAIAITHDAHWTTLLERELIKPEDLAKQDLLEELVWNMLSATREGAVYLQYIPCDEEGGSSASSDEIDSAEEAGATIPTTQYDSQNEVVRTLPRKVLNTLEVQQPDPHESRSSSASVAKPLRPILKGSGCAPTSSTMTSKQRHNVKFIPDTPKLSKLSIQGEPSPEPHPTTTESSKTLKSILKGDESADKRRPSPKSPNFVPETPKLLKLSLPSKGLNLDPPPTIGQPGKPLKSILKGGNGADRHDTHENKSDKLSGKKAVHSRYTTPEELPPGSQLVPMKLPAFNLSWMLLPYDPRRSRGLLRFDMAFPVDEIIFECRGLRRKLFDSELETPAVDGFMVRMPIAFEHGPFSWEVDVKNTSGICCRDVFEAIYKTFNEQLTLEEQRLVGDRRAVEEAFRLRCKLAPGISEVERSYGWKRVDALLHKTIFLGLTQPKSGADWVLNLGPPPRVPDVS